MKSFRIDRAAPLHFDDAPATPTRSRAETTPEGYLVVDAYIARDGLLRYTASDGSSWVEYRPRRELEAAASSWGPGTPVTDDHPRVMVSSATWSAVAKGVHLDTAQVEIVDGIAYLRARLQITDRTLVAKIRGDGMPAKTQVSIGFATDVVPCKSGVAPDGTRCDAMQTNLLANHTAIVDRGRAGPTVRILDAFGEVREWPCYTDPARPGSIPVKHKVKTTVAKPRPIAVKLDGFDASRVDLSHLTIEHADEAGAPTDEVEVIGPDGEPIKVQTWIAAALADYAALKAQAAMQAAGGSAAAPMPAPPAPPAAAPDAPMADASAPVLPAAPVPEDPKKTENMDAAQITAATRARARLERLAAKAGVDDTTIDRSDDAELRAAYVEKMIPKAELSALRQRLDDEAIVEVAAVAATRKVEPAKAPARFGAVQSTKADARADALDGIDPDVLAEAMNLTAAGI